MTTRADVSLLLFLCSPAPKHTQEVEVVDAPEIRPFYLEEEEEEAPAAPPSSPPQPDQSESTDNEALSQGLSEPNKNLIELETAEESNNKTQEVRDHQITNCTLTWSLSVICQQFIQCMKKIGINCFSNELPENGSDASWIL